MDNFLKGCGRLGVLLVCQAMLVIVVVVHNIGALDGGGSAFVEAAIPAIATTWDAQAMLDRASPKFKQATTPAQLTAMFGKLTPLGTMVSFEPPQREAVVVHGSSGAQDASYVSKARFQNGDALVRLTLVKADGRWMINHFHIETLPRLADRTGS